MNAVYTPEHEMFRDTLRKFIEKEMEPRMNDWDAQGSVDRDIWYKAGEAGLLGAYIPEEYGGVGGDDLYNVILSEELGHYPCGASIGASFTSDIAGHLLVRFGTHEQKSAWCPKILSGEAIQCLALTEPGAGSDLSGMTTSAQTDGDDFIINGNKTYISNGPIADLVYVVARTDNAQGPHDLSIFLVDGKSEGVEVRPLKMMGADLYPVGEFFFDNVRVSKQNILGEENAAFKVLLSTFALDRIQIAARSLAAAELAFDITLDFVKNRKVFGKTVFDFQNTQFKLAEMKTDLTVGRDFLDGCLTRYMSGDFDLSIATMAKIWICEMEQRVANECLQLHGGAGYMDEYTISRIYTNARLQTLYAGTTEIGKISIARTL